MYTRIVKVKKDLCQILDLVTYEWLFKVYVHGFEHFT